MGLTMFSKMKFLVCATFAISAYGAADDHTTRITSTIKLHVGTFKVLGDNKYSGDTPRDVNDIFTTVDNTIDVEFSRYTDSRLSEEDLKKEPIQFSIGSPKYRGHGTWPLMDRVASVKQTDGTNKVVLSEFRAKEIRRTWGPSSPQLEFTCDSPESAEIFCASFKAIKWPNSECPSKLKALQNPTTTGSDPKNG